MKHNTIYISVIALLSILAGYLLSSISLVGRVGIGLFYKEYRFLKTWWKGALLIFIVWLFLSIIHHILHKKVSKRRYNIISAISLIIAVAGLYFSYSDFSHTLSHRWLGERFHLGVYLFWLGWMGIIIKTLLQKKPEENNDFSLPHASK
jgi:hypothetical protein